MRKSSSKRPCAKALTALVALALITIGCSARVPTGTDISPWETRYYDSARTNRSPEATEMPPLTKWKKVFTPAGLANFYSRIENSSPAVAGGLVFVGSANGKFYALNRSGGWTAWVFEAGSPVDSSPSVSEGLVCFGSSNGALRCLNAFTGVEQWSFQAKSEILSSPLLKDGRLYFYSSDDRLYSLDLKTGKKLWAYTRGTFKTVSPRNSASPAIAVVRGKARILQLFTDGSLVCLEADTGRVLWEKRVLKDPAHAGVYRKTPLVMEGNVYIIDAAGSIAAYSIRDGSQVDSYAVEKAVDFVFTDPDTLVIAGKESITAFDRVTNSALWKKAVRRGPVKSIFASGSHIFILSNYKTTPLGFEFLAGTNGYVQALSTSDGRVVWKKKLGSSISAEGSVAEGGIPLILDEGRLVFFTTKLRAPQPPDRPAVLSP